MTAAAPPFTELIAGTTISAAHLEMRDAYTPRDADYIAWQGGRPIKLIVQSPDHQWWSDLVRTHVERGVEFRRARVVSEPHADFIRYEYESTPHLNLPAGEQVRWLPRRRASDLCLPGNDFWLFDDRLVRFAHFAGDGEFLDDEICDEPSVVSLCAAAFNAVWQRAIDHANYHPLR